MSVLEHLDELRKRLIIAGSATAATVLFSAFVLTSPIITLLTQPAGIKLAALRPAETFTTYMKVAMTAGIALAMPIIIWQLMLFVLPGLKPNEKRWVYVGIPAITVAFAIGLTFGFFLVIPFAVRFLLGFMSDVIEAVWSVEAYLSFVSSLLLWIGVSFETPIVLFFLAKIGVVNSRMLAHYRRYALVGAFIIGAIITPTPDPFNQTIVSVPIYLLYELGVLLARFA
jgi:sec-independent protein translocase protein TatC